MNTRLATDQQSEPNSTTTILCGYLFKLSGKSQSAALRGFKKRWFIYSPSDCKLNYYRAKGDLIKKGDIDVRRATFSINPVQESTSASQSSGPDGGQLTFTINTPDKQHTLKASDQKSTLFWLQELQRLRKEYIMNLAKDFGIDLKPHHVLGDGGANWEVNVIEVPSGHPPTELKPGLDRRGTNVSLSTFYVDGDGEDVNSSSRRSSLSGGSSMATSVTSSKPPLAHSQSNVVTRESRNHDVNKRKSLGFGSRVMAGIRSRAESMTRSGGERTTECKKCIELNCKLIAINDEHEAVLNEFQASREVIHLLQKQLDTSQKEAEVLKELLRGRNVQNDVLGRLCGLESKLTESESSLSELRRKYTKLTADHELLKQNHDSSLDQVSILCDTIEAKDKSIYALTNELYERDCNFQVINPGTIDYQSNMDKLKDSLAAYKLQNEFLNKEIVEINSLRNLTDKRCSELALKSSEWEAKCCQIQSKLLSLLKEINLSIEKRNTRMDSPSFATKEDNLVTLNEPTVNLVTRLLEDISVDIPLSWKRGNRSRNEDPTVNLASRVSTNYDDLGFSSKARNSSVVEVDDPPPNNLLKSLSILSGGGSDIEANCDTKAAGIIQQSNWKSRWDAYVGALGSSQELNRQDLKPLLRSGIPREYRCKIWKGLINLRVRHQRESAGHDYYNSLLNSKSTNLSPNSTSSSLIYDPIIKQIELDLLRTLPENKHFESLESDGTCRLRRVLIAYSRHNPDVGYCQGLNRLAAVSLLFMPEEEAFWALVAIIEYLMPPDYYNSSLLGAHVDQHVFRDLLADKMPQLSAHLTSFGIEISLFSWFLTCFIDNIPVDVYLRIWDVFLYEGNKVLFRFALAFLKMHEPLLLSSNDSVTINTLLRTIGQRSINVKELCKIAFSLLNPFPMSKVKAKRAHYTLLVKSELDKLENMRKTLPRSVVSKELTYDHDDED